MTREDRARLEALLYGPEGHSQIASHWAMHPATEMRLTLDRALCMSDLDMTPKRQNGAAELYGLPIRLATGMPENLIELRDGAALLANMEIKS